MRFQKLNFLKRVGTLPAEANKSENAWTGNLELRFLGHRV